MTLTGKTAERFIQIANESSKNKHTVNFEKEMIAMYKILRKSNLG